MRATGFVAGLTLSILSAGFGSAEAADYAGRLNYHAGHRHHLRASVGTCVRTRVESVGAIPGPSEAAMPVIRYRDGVIQAYDGDMLGHQETRPGDAIQLCLVSFTRDCDEDELPGRTYATGNLRTGAAWTLPDVRSSCSVR
jgi:hypothetical protein